MTHAVAVSPELLQKASIITPEGVTVDPNNKEELKKYDNRHDLSELADALRKEFGVTASQLTQLMACTGPVVCKVPSVDGKRIYTYQGSGNIALQPNILVTVKHAFQDLGTGQLLPIDTCRFHNWKNPKDEIAIVIDDPSQLPPIATSMSNTGIKTARHDRSPQTCPSCPKVASLWPSLKKERCCKKAIVFFKRRRSKMAGEPVERPRTR